MDPSLIKRLVQFDRTRKSFPGEHWLALAAGLWFLKRKGNSLPATLVSKAIGSALLFRAASGRDGLQKLWKDTPYGRPAAPSPIRGTPMLDMDDVSSATATSSSPRAALLQPPVAGMPAASPETSSRGRAGGFPDFR